MKGWKCEQSGCSQIWYLNSLSFFPYILKYLETANIGNLEIYVCGCTKGYIIFYYSNTEKIVRREHK